MMYFDFLKAEIRYCPIFLINATFRVEVVNITFGRIIVLPEYESPKLSERYIDVLSCINWIQAILSE